MCSVKIPHAAAIVGECGRHVCGKRRRGNGVSSGIDKRFAVPVYGSHRAGGIVGRSRGTLNGRMDASILGSLLRICWWLFGIIWAENRFRAPTRRVVPFVAGLLTGEFVLKVEYVPTTSVDDFKTGAVYSEAVMLP